ncbi:Chaperone protein EcpD precursor [compost metagenome]
MSSRALLLFGLLLALAGQEAAAGVTAERTRVIFPEGAREVSLLVVNLNKYPVLTQLWIDDGSLDSTPDKAVAPIMPLPAMFRMEPEERRSLRLLFTGDKLPSDRESLFWLNIYEVPPKPKAPLPPESSRLTLAMRTQMKVFYRPKDLSPRPEAVNSKLIFSLHQKAGAPVLRAENPGPYYVTLSHVELQKAGSIQPIAGTMLAPFSENDLPIDAPVPDIQGKFAQGDVAYSWVDDNGISQESHAKLH